MLDMAMAKQITEIHQLQVTLTPTERAKNQFQLQGRVDASKTNLFQGNLTLSSDSLDLTRYYELLFAGTRQGGGQSGGRAKQVAEPNPGADCACRIRCDDQFAV